jgi:hypothetical protein
MANKGAVIQARFAGQVAPHGMFADVAAAVEAHEEAILHIGQG